MAVMTRAGISTLEVLVILRKQAKSAAFRSILDYLTEQVKNGRYLSDGLAKYKKIFGDFFINIIRVGEVSGTLADNLEYLADSLKKRKELESKVRGALVYPIIILVATVGMTGILTFYIFPKILPVFKTLKVALPLSTRIFIAGSTFILNNGLLTLGIIVAIVVFIWAILHIRKVRYYYDRLLLTLPVLSTMVRDYNMVIFSRSMALLLKSGVQIVQALLITSNTTENLVYRDSLQQISEQVNQGDLISTHLIGKDALYPPVFAQMISVGERTGKLNETGIYLAEYYDSELDGSTKALSNILEPLLLVVMGGVVMFVALAIIMPIYKVTQSIER